MRWPSRCRYRYLHSHATTMLRMSQAMNATTTPQKSASTRSIALNPLIVSCHGLARAEFPARLYPSL